MANILDEQERKRKELAAQGIRTRGVAGAQGGSAEIGYVPPSLRNAPINQIPPQNASPQADYARSAEGGAMIPPDKVGQARMLGSMPNHGSLTPFKQPADTWIQRSRDFTQSRVGGTNQQLQMHRNEMGTTDTSLTQMAAQLDPSIRQDAERARQWRIMSPQQRRDEVDRLAMEQDARTAEQAFTGTWEDIQKYARSLADPTGMFIDSYGRENPMYSPGTAERIRGYQRKIESAIARMMSSYDRTKWDSPQAFLDAVSALPEVIEAGEFGKSIVFNIVRKYATPTMRAQMEAEDRNMKLFEQAGTKKALEEIVQKMAQEGRVNPKYANGYRLTNDGTKELLRQVWLNKDNDPRAGYIVNEIMANAPVMWMEEGGRVVKDPAHEERRRMMLKQLEQQAEMLEIERTAKAAAAAQEEELRALEEYEDKRYAAIQQMNPERAAMMIKNPITRKYEDLKEFKAGSPDPVDISKVNTAYAEARKSHQTVSRQMEIQQIDPIEFKKKAISDAVSFGAEDFEKQGIANIINGISADNDMSAQEIINAIAASGFSAVFNAEAFQKAMTEYEEAKNISPQVLDAQKRMLEEKISQIERDVYGVDAEKERSDAIAWLEANPNDPRADAVRQKLGLEEKISQIERDVYGVDAEKERSDAIAWLEANPNDPRADAVRQKLGL